MVAPVKVMFLNNAKLTNALSDWSSIRTKRMPKMMLTARSVSDAGLPQPRFAP